MKFFRKNQVIPEEWVGEKIFVYNGIRFQRKTVTMGMVGLKIGSFIWTKRTGPQIHQKEKKKQKRGKR